MNKIVLIVDDDEMLRTTLAAGLRAEGFDILTADGADAAAAVLSRVTVDAIVLDRMMVGMDGLTFLRQIRAAGDATPVIMLTAMTGPENAIDGLSTGADDYLAKPFQLRELVLRLGKIMRKRDGASGALPAGLIFADDEFFVASNDGPRALGLSGEEKKLLQKLTMPVGNIVPAAPMVAKRLRAKLNVVLSGLDILTIRGQGYKLVDLTHAPQQNGMKK